MASSTTLSLLLLLLLLPFSHSTTFTIINHCPYTIWPAAIPGGGRQLNPNQTWTLPINSTTTGSRIWARTNCTFNNSGHLHCQTGDCDNLLQCQTSGKPPNTLVEFALNQFNHQDLFDVSLIDGFNVPVEFTPVKGCASSGARCAADVTAQCPAVLRVPGGCNHPCTVFNNEEYCCFSGNCGTNDYFRFFKSLCPGAYISPSLETGQASTLTCPSGTQYRVVFCPN
ncbi:hypothetical protein J5N97_008682 [Dioscorea zingiberensis]|uniref:Thaumatin-like protein n=1 Tax=Dioscorea zingiberensis TaxID=325984 RepID=A0A9D5CXE5_9LILI|nr:hypothetical protein J5N97_008682 [Dioscorea zingiberensis]